MRVSPPDSLTLFLDGVDDERVSPKQHFIGLEFIGPTFYSFWLGSQFRQQANERYHRPVEPKLGFGFVAIDVQQLKIVGLEEIA